nr:MAG TPA: hypothetical protein [Caudoviricetes sp.]
MYSSDLRNKGTNKRSGTSQGAFLFSWEFSWQRMSGKVTAMLDGS